MSEGCWWILRRCCPGQCTVMGDCSGCCADRGLGQTFPRNFCGEGVFQAKDSRVCFSTRCIFVGADLSGCEAMRDQEVKFLVGTTAGQQEADASAVNQDHRTDLKGL